VRLGGNENVCDIEATVNLQASEWSNDLEQLLWSRSPTRNCDLSRWQASGPGERPDYLTRIDGDKPNAAKASVSQLLPVAKLDGDPIIGDARRFNQSQKLLSCADLKNRGIGRIVGRCIHQSSDWER
jgi:hypothetical protein